MAEDRKETRAPSRAGRQIARASHRQRAEIDGVRATRTRARSPQRRQARPTGLRTRRHDEPAADLGSCLHAAGGDVSRKRRRSAGSTCSSSIIAAFRNAARRSGFPIRRGLQASWKKSIAAAAIRRSAACSTHVRKESKAQKVDALGFRGRRDGGVGRRSLRQGGRARAARRARVRVSGGDATQSPSARFARSRA